MKYINYFEQHIAHAMYRAQVPGLAVTIVKDQAISYSNVFGVKNLATKRPLTGNTPFQAASLSKPVFAYAVLKLCQKGLLLLDKPLTDYGPKPDIEAELPLTHLSPPITARHVLNHTTGFPNWRTGKRLISQSRAGERFSYSGEGYEYLKGIVEHLTEQPFHDYIGANLLAPLEMQDSTFRWGVDEAGDLLLDEVDDIIPEVGYPISGAAYSLLTTAPDYARFLLAMLNPDEEDNFRLDTTHITMMLTPQIQVGPRKALSWGLGWGLQHTKAGDAFWHWGGPQNGYTSYTITFQAQKIGVVILTNSENGLTICEKIAQIALDNETPQPAFEWLLPLDTWQPDGS